jgi:hypothetical protein
MARFEVLILHVLEIGFFAGIAGCALVILISWISIFKEGFTKDKPTDI